MNDMVNYGVKRKKKIYNFLMLVLYLIAANEIPSDETQAVLKDIMIEHNKYIENSKGEEYLTEKNKIKDCGLAIYVYVRRKNNLTNYKKYELYQINEWLQNDIVKSE